jgi:hypothetical protein
MREASLTFRSFTQSCKGAKKAKAVFLALIHSLASLAPLLLCVKFLRGPSKHQSPIRILCGKKKNRKDGRRGKPQRRTKKKTTKMHEEGTTTSAKPAG